MELQQAIKSRKSIRKFSSSKPDWREIIECIDSCRYAPMAGNNFSLIFIIVSDDKKINQLAETAEQMFIADASYVVVVCSEISRTTNSFGERGKIYLRQQAGAAIQNFLLSLNERGIDTCWIGHFLEEPVKKILKIPDSIQVEAMFPLGYETKQKGMKTKQKRKIELDRILRFNDYKTKTM